MYNYLNRLCNLILILVTAAATSYAQETVLLTGKNDLGLSEKYHVLKSNQQIKEVLYQAVNKKNAVASGLYNQGKKVGIWHFYDLQGKLVQHYDYDNKKLMFEAPHDTTAYKIEYNFDKQTQHGDTVTRPVKIGGIFYGFLPYTTKFKIENEAMYSPNAYYGVMQILVSPYGRLAECKLMIRSKLDNAVIDTYILNTELLTDDEKTFIPATINRQAVAASIYIYCYIQSNWHISIYGPDYVRSVQKR